MQWQLVAGATLMVALAAAHSILGERYILMRLFRRELPHLFGDDQFTKRTLRFVWHALTVIWVAVAGILLVAQPATLAIVAAALVATALLTMAINVRHLSWVVELAIAGLIGWALWLSGG